MNIHTFLLYTFYTHTHIHFVHTHTFILHTYDFICWDLVYILHWLFTHFAVTYTPRILICYLLFVVNVVGLHGLHLRTRVYRLRTRTRTRTHARICRRLALDIIYAAEHGRSQDARHAAVLRILRLPAFLRWLHGLRPPALRLCMPAPFTYAAGLCMLAFTGYDVVPLLADL